MKHFNFLRTLVVGVLLLLVGGAKADVTSVKLDMATGSGTESDPYVVTLGTGEYQTSADFDNKYVQIIGNGAQSTTLWYGNKKGANSGSEAGSEYNFEGAHATFKDMTLKDVNGDTFGYDGFVRCNSLLFEGCTFTSMLTYIGAGDAIFKTCTFNHPDGYTAWLYGSQHYTFDGCTFNVSNRVFNVYNEGAIKPVIIMSNCTINGTAHNKAVFAIKGTANGSTISISNSTCTGLLCVDSDAAVNGGVWYQMEGNHNNNNVLLDGLVINKNGEIQNIQESEISNVAQTTVDVEISTDETAEGVSDETIVSAIQGVTEKTTTVNAETAIAAEAIEGVSSTKNYLHIDVKAAEVVKPSETAYVKSMTFDIKPIAANIKDGKLTTEVIPNSAIKSKITFRLPVDANATETMAKVFHNGESMGKYYVQGTTDKYIEVSTTSFSEFGYQLLDAPATSNVAKIGANEYATLAEAVAAAKTGETITLLADVAYGEFEGTALNIPTGKEFTLDLNGLTISGTATNAGTSQLINIAKGAKVTIVDNGGNGKIVYDSAHPDPSWTYGTYTIHNAGTLTLNSGRIENNTVNGASYAIENHMNWQAEDVVFNMTGGVVTCPKGDQAVRLYSNWGGSMTTVGKSIMNMTGGIIEAGGIWVNDQVATGKGGFIELNISGENTIVNGMLDFIGAKDQTCVNIYNGQFGDCMIRLRKTQSCNNTKPYVNIYGGNWDLTAIQNQNTDGVTTNTMKIAAGRYHKDPNEYAIPGIKFNETAEGWWIIGIDAVLNQNIEDNNESFNVQIGNEESVLENIGISQITDFIEEKKSGANVTAVNLTGLNNIIKEGETAATVAEIHDAVKTATGTANAIVILNESYSNTESVANVVIKNTNDTYTCDQLVLTDGAAFATPVDFTATSIAKYTRGGNKWGTLCLPYEITCNDPNVSLYVIDESKPHVVVDGQSFLKLIPKTTLEANTPCLYRKADGKESEVVQFNSTDNLIKAGGAGHDMTGTIFNLHGVYATTTLTQGDETDNYYFISNNQFWGLENGASVKVNPFRAYLTLVEDPGFQSGSQNARSFGLMIDDEVLTGIEAAEAMEALGLADGKYIENGKVVIVKNGQKYNLNGTK